MEKKQAGRQNSDNSLKNMGGSIVPEGYCFSQGVTEIPTVGWLSTQSRQGLEEKLGSRGMLFMSFASRTLRAPFLCGHCSHPASQA